MLENRNSRPVALHLVKQDIKYVPAAGELRAEGVDSRQTSLVHSLHILSAFPLCLNVCVSVRVCVSDQCRWSFDVTIMNLPPATGSDFEKTPHGLSQISGCAAYSAAAVNVTLALILSQ